MLFIYDMIRKSGNNKSMENVSYTVWPREHIESASIGFTLDYYMEPFDSGSYGEQVLGSEYGKIFNGTSPAIWRFTKD